jgi:Flp pilus assembly protein TadB
MLALRAGFTLAVMVVAIWLASNGQPFGGLVIVPLIAVWIRNAAETGRLQKLAERLAGTP